jgi:O-acetyl-ADP-ribose deacetylase (regulator of RNase III)
MQTLGSFSLSCGGGSGNVTVCGLAGSVLDFEGDAFVNAANAGGVTGFGLDEMVNKAGGPEMKEARRKFDGIPTATARSTPSFNHAKTRFVIHATGPVFRQNRMSNKSVEELYAELRATYRAALAEAATLGCKDLAFCLLSAGVFRGEEPLANIIGEGLRGIKEFFDELSVAAGASFPERVFVVAFTSDEADELKRQLQIMTAETAGDESQRLTT